MDQKRNQTHYVFYDLSSFVKFDINYLFTAVKRLFDQINTPIVSAAFISKYKFTIKDDKEAIEAICIKHDIPFFVVNNTDEYIIKKVLQLDGIKHVVTNSPSVVSSLISIGDPEQIKFILEKNAENTIKKLPGITSFSLFILSILPKKMKYIGALLKLKAQQLKKARGLSLKKDEIDRLKSFLPAEMSELKKIFKETFPDKTLIYLANFLFYHCSISYANKTVTINPMNSMPLHSSFNVSPSAAEETTTSVF